MVETRSRAKSGCRLTRAKSNWKPTSTKSAEIDEHEEENGGTNSAVNTQRMEEECTCKEPQAESLDTDDYEEPHTESNEQDSSEDDEADTDTDTDEQDSYPDESTDLAEEDQGIFNPLSLTPEWDDVTNEQEELEPQIVTQGLNKEKKVIHFNDKGQLIGEGSGPLTSEIGKITRKHCPVSYENWKAVPGPTRDILWKLITDKYVIPVAFKPKIIIKVCNSWRKYKSMLRANHYDIYHTDEERRRNCPKGVRQDVWNKFVYNQSTPAAQAQRIAGKKARQAMKTPHFSGRSGAARMAESLKKRNPSGTVSRTELYLALHSRADRSCPIPELAEKVEKIKAIAMEDPSSINLDVDHDPVAQVCGPEKGGCPVRGMGAGVSKRSLHHSAIAIHHLQHERELRIAAERQLSDLRKKVGSSEPVDTSILRGVSKVSLRHSAIAIHHLQRERGLRIAAEKQLADLREKVVSPEPVETHKVVSSEPVETDKVVSLEPVETHSSGTQWFQNTPILRKRKSIREPKKSDHEMSPSSKKRKEFEDDDVGMDCKVEAEEDAVSVSNEDDSETRLMDPVVWDVDSDNKSSNGLLQTSGSNCISKGDMGDGDGTPVSRTPRIIVETQSEVDVVDDGYHWRKYGVKIVKGNSHPRNYYRCSNGGCSAKKHVERAANNSRSIITIYEGKHNHDLPPPRFAIHDLRGTIISSREEIRDGPADNDKDKGHKKSIKVNKEEDEKMKMTTVANNASQVAVGGYDMLTYWRLMAKQARKKRSYSRLLAKQVLKNRQGRGSVSASGAAMICGKSGVPFHKVW